MSMELQDKLAEKEQALAKLKAEYQEFVYIVSHDLSAPLRHIEGFTEIIKEKHIENFDESSSRYLDIIVESANKAKQMLESLRLCSRVNTQAQPFTVCDCNDILKTVKLQLLPEIKNANADINYTTLPIVFADKNQLEQLFYHLLHNALLYQVPSNKAEISINFKEQTNEWLFCIKDNGIGVIENANEKIFKILRRGVLEDTYPGVGLGLALVERIVQRHGGRVWVENNKDVKGASFYFTLAKH